ncbi:hypothetical protein [Rhizobium sp. BK176]|uniref:hypothetical protein n=1 Tax=Rhizobium sp. BK176 TaxID=2587071 RepID=UPI0021679808|nr:hypothetical protein [Rhizobium sp. BK176]MCS4089484.1 hypothetical protein [Rhizobium sp. BK176]
MKISELIALRADAVAKDPSAILPTTVFGVEVDDGFMDTDVPPGLSEIGIVARFLGDGDLSEEILDLVIAYGMSPQKPSVLLEIPAEAEIVDIKHTISTIEAIGAGGSFLPPENLDDASFEAYCQRIEAATEVWCSNVNFDNVMLPISSYFQHMVVELLDPTYASNFVPDDGYVLSRFHERVPLEKSDILKARIRTVVRNAFTGEDGVDRFDEVMIGICSKAVAQVEYGTSELARLHAAEQSSEAQSGAETPAQE